mmetsp:Transcript_12554/g.43937  ORF Transcript_12554/g.43937 Transcript_12554/m.43937 type:complete len:202 (+) Transcript_12554:273-878(+)
MSDSDTFSAMPTADMMRRTTPASSFRAWRPRANAAAPTPTSAGVLGITRTMRVPSGQSAAMVSIATPAAMETTRWSAVSKRPTSRSTGATYCGLTARMTTSLARTSSELSVVTTPTKGARASRVAGVASATSTLSFSAAPLLIRPLARLDPIMPPPMKPTRCASGASPPPPAPPPAPPLIVASLSPTAHRVPTAPCERRTV